MKNLKVNAAQTNTVKEFGDFFGPISWRIYAEDFIAVPQIDVPFDFFEAAVQQRADFI